MPDKMRAYDERSRYMVDRSNVAIAVFDERAVTRDGTARTVAYAREQGKQIIQIRCTEFQTAERGQAGGRFSLG